MFVVPHLIWAGVVLFIVHELRTFANKWYQATTVDPLAPVDVPDDLLALAAQERELWAQEETLRAIRERYDALKDWNMVRSAFGIGQRN